MEIRMLPQQWGVQRERRDEATGEFVGDRRLVFQDQRGDVIVIGPLSDELWEKLVEFVNDPAGVAERARAREKLVVPVAPRQ